MTSRHWTFTYNLNKLLEAWEGEDEWEESVEWGFTKEYVTKMMRSKRLGELMCEQCEDEERVTHMFAQLEIGEGGNWHYQGCMITKPIRLTGAIKCLPQGAHVEKMMDPSYLHHLETYCEKKETQVLWGDEPIEWECGSRPNNAGFRSDLAEVADKVKKGEKMSDVAASHPDTFIRNYRGLGALRSLSMPDRSYMTELHIIWGASGVGKTRFVHEKEKDLYVKPSGPWWDGYDGQEAVLFDDVLWLSLYTEYHGHTEWLKLIDRYPHKVPIKGGMVKFIAKRVYITSMYDPSVWKAEGIPRRITSITKM